MRYRTRLSPCPRFAAPNLPSHKPDGAWRTCHCPLSPRVLQGALARAPSPFGGAQMSIWFFFARLGAGSNTMQTDSQAEVFMTIQLRKNAEERIKAGTAPLTRAWPPGTQALTLLHSLASAPESAGRPCSSQGCCARLDPLFSVFAQLDRHEDLGL